jgi:hypothetical protein
VVNEKMESMVNKYFDNLAQRSIYYFLATIPAFKGINSTEASESEQKNAYDFIMGIYERLYAEPGLLGLKLEADDSFDDWEQQNIKPTLTPKIRGTIKKIDEFIYTIYKIVSIGHGEEDTLIVSNNDLPLKPSVLKLLSKFGVQTRLTETSYIFTFPSDTIKGLKLLAKVSAENTRMTKGSEPKFHLLFSRGVFDVQASYTREVFGNMFEDRTAFDKLLDFLEEAGYTRIDNKEYGNGISLDYIKNYGNPEEELKWAWAERTRGGIELLYEEVRRKQPLLSLRVPYFGELLKNANKMNDKVKNFVTTTSKKCDGCRYCVQTDKTGKRPFVFVKVDEYNICPLFCGFQYRWRTINEETVDNIIEMLKFVDESFAEKSA